LKFDPVRSVIIFTKSAWLMFGCLNSPIEYMLHCNTVQASSPDYLALTTAALIHDFAQCWQLATLKLFMVKSCVLICSCFNYSGAAIYMDHSMDVTKAKASASASADAGAGAGAGSPSVADVARDGDEQDVGSRAQIHDASLKNGLPLPGALSPWVPKSEFQNSETSDSSSAGITSSPPEHCPRVYIVNRRHNAIVKREMQHRHCNYKKAGQDILEQLKYFQHKSPFLVIDEQSTSTGQEDERKHGQQLAVFGAANAVTGSDGIHKDDIVSVAMAGSYQQDDSSSRP
jgi:hypothetical protein